MSIFRSYDVRGVYGKDITEDIMRGIGNALGNHVRSDVVVGRDCRLSSKNLSAAFIEGVLRAGKDVTDVGEVPLGAGMFYAWREKKEYAFITASHLPKEWNGVKFFHANGIGFIEEENMKVRDAYLKGPAASGKRGSVMKPAWDVLGGYKSFLLSKSKARKRLKVVLDCGNGMAGMIAPAIFREAGFEVEVLFERPDGNFPNRSPDQMEDPLNELRKRVVKADFGIAYDGDGDRMVLVSRLGKKLTPEQSSYFMLTEILKKESGPVIANVECTRAIDVVAERFNRPLKRIKVGHTFLMENVHKEKACFGVEVSGHYVVPSMLPFDDSLAVSLYAASVLSSRDGPLEEEIKGMPVYPFERVNFDCSDQKKFQVVEGLKKEAGRLGKASFLDGIRVDMDRGWVLIRASNTGPTIRLTVEGETEKEKEEIKRIFSVMLERAIKG